MKQYIYQMMILAVSTCLWSCQDDDPKPTVVEEPDWKLELVETIPNRNGKCRKVESISSV